jgi:hypothetical protein
MNEQAEGKNRSDHLKKTKNKSNKRPSPNDCCAGGGLTVESV